METLIIEVYVSRKRHHEIQVNGVFRPLDALIAYIKNDTLHSRGEHQKSWMRSNRSEMPPRTIERTNQTLPTCEFAIDV